MASEGPHNPGDVGGPVGRPMSPDAGSLRGDRWLLFSVREPGGFTDGGDTLLPVQTPNPIESLGKAQDLPLHAGECSSAFAAMAKWVFPCQKAMVTSLMLREMARGFLSCSTVAAEIPKIPLAG